jgi:chemotaxis protein MotB
MSDRDKEEPVIIRKKISSSDDDHHGGVWKLAFADFMTAMMAFFLVMWLINSTSKETKAVIVQYFNPVKLTDSTPAIKGLSDPAPSQTPAGAEKQEARDIGKKNAGNVTEEDLHADPLRALDRIAEREVESIQTQTGGRDRFSDPFERPPPHVETIKQTPTEASSSPLTEIHTEKDLNGNAGIFRREIEKIIRQEARNRYEAPTVEVKAAEGGVLISLTDVANFNMFGVGSIEPRPQLVRILGQIGKILAERPGEIEIRGYTDGRSYASRNYDNWRLSSDRATVVNYTLVRGGLQPSRVEKVVGYADRHLKNPREPFSPLNRRIEIFLRPEK